MEAPLPHNLIEKTVMSALCMRQRESLSRWAPDYTDEGREDAMRILVRGLSELLPLAMMECLVRHGRPLCVAQKEAVRSSSNNDRHLARHYCLLSFNQGAICCSQP